MIGATVLLTRSAEDNLAWASALSSIGVRSLSLPCLACRFVDDPEASRALEAAIDDARWLALTSRRGVAAVSSMVGTDLGQTKVACVGPSTARAARDAFGVEAFSPDTATGQALAHALLEQSEPGALSPLVVAGANRANPTFDHVLTQAGVTVRRFAVYETLPAQQGTVPVPDLSQVDTIFLSSPSAAEGLLNLLGTPPQMPVVTIGPTTTQAAAIAGFNVGAEASTRGLDGLVSAFESIERSKNHPQTRQEKQ